MMAAHNAIRTRPVVEWSTFAWSNNRQGHNKTVDKPKANVHPGLIHSSWNQQMKSLMKYFPPLALCSRNFQNVKLWLDFVEIWSFYRKSDFTWNQYLVDLNSPKMLFLAISEGLNFDFSKFGQVSSPKKF